jgi:hypothetical protein
MAAKSTLDWSGSLTRRPLTSTSVLEVAVAPKPRRPTEVWAPSTPPNRPNICTPASRARSEGRSAAGSWAMSSAVITLVEAAGQPVIEPAGGDFSTWDGADSSVVSARAGKPASAVTMPADHQIGSFKGHFSVRCERWPHRCTDSESAQQKRVTAAKPHQCGPSVRWLGDCAGRSPGSRVVAHCVRPSRFPSGLVGRGLAAYSCGGSRGCDPRMGRSRRVPSCLPGANRGTSTGRRMS